MSKAVHGCEMPKLIQSPTRTSTPGETATMRVLVVERSDPTRSSVRDHPTPRTVDRRRHRQALIGRNIASAEADEREAVLGR